MPIVNQRIIEDAPQIDGRRYIRYEFTDQLGAKHIVGPILVPTSFDADADLLLRVAGVAQRLIDNETDTFEGNPLTATFKHTNKRKVIRRVLLAAMREDNPKELLKYKPVIIWLRANYTGSQVATYLRIPLAKLSRLANRIDALILVESTINADAAEDIE